MKKYFIYNDQYLSGGRYWLRIFLQALLVSILIGFYLWGITTYARAKSLDHSQNTSIVFAILNPILLIVAVVLNSVNKYDYVNYEMYLFFIIICLSLHIYLWFANGSVNLKKIETKN
jgi:hypothetical protein